VAEGRSTVYYRSDIIKMFDNTGAPQKAQFAVSVPNNLVAQAELGWVGADATLPTGVKLPKRLRPRHVVGVSPAGKRIRAVVASDLASIWGTSPATWTYIDNFGATITATATGYVGEAATV
jgi:hypothetical protein